LEKYCNYICKQCAEKRRVGYRRRDGMKHMSENKECAVYLGVYVAERVLSKVFKDVEVMPYGHSGYDFICNKGKKIDVKAACSIIRKTGWSESWTFHIRRNGTADYFLCLAFDNRENLNPLHAWLLPSNKFNHLITTTISTSTVVKWDEYRIDVAKVAESCNELKNIEEE
jgi:hypothetical protein